jgi:RNAse (barnase) inhibitor barstar
MQLLFGLIVSMTWTAKERAAVFYCIVMIRQKAHTYYQQNNFHNTFRHGIMARGDHRMNLPKLWDLCLYSTYLGTEFVWHYSQKCHSPQQCNVWLEPSPLKNGKEDRNTNPSGKFAAQALVYISREAICFGQVEKSVSGNKYFHVLLRKKVALDRVCALIPAR